MSNLIKKLALLFVLFVMTLSQTVQPYGKEAEKIIPSKKGPTTTWPETVGLSGKVAQRIIMNEQQPNVVIVPYGSFVTTDYKFNRIRLFLGPDGNVAEVPKRG